MKKLAAMLLAAGLLAATLHAGDKPRNYTASQFAGPVYIMQNGYVVAEAENLSLTGVWEKRTDAGSYTNNGCDEYLDKMPQRYTGSGYMRYIGPKRTGDGASQDPDQIYQGDHENWMVMKIWTEEAGYFKMDVRNYHQEQDGDNDIWGGYIGMTDPPLKLHDCQYKLYSWLEKVKSVKLNKGLNAVYLSGRSTGFGVDRIVVYNHAATGVARHPDTPESPVQGKTLLPKFKTSPAATGNAPAVVNFDAGESQKKTGTTISSYTWSFGDGASGTGRTVSHTYQKNGLYEATLTVRDSRGASASVTKNVLVGEKAPKVLFVVEQMMLPRPDGLIYMHLVNRGYTVQIISDMTLNPGMVSNYALVLVSSSVRSSGVNTKLTDADVPVIVCDPMVFDDMGMSGTVENTDFGFAANVSNISISGGSHDLAGSRSGTVRIGTNATVTWAKPTGNAEVIASIAGSPDKAVIFGYEAGAFLNGLLTAPARRMGFFMAEEGVEKMTSAGWDLLDASLEWGLAAAATGIAGSGVPVPFREITGVSFADGVLHVARARPGTEVKICDMSGVVRFTASLKDGNGINVPELPAGIYTVVVSNGKASGIARIAVVK